MKPYLLCSLISLGFLTGCDIQSTSTTPDPAVVQAKLKRQQDSIAEQKRYEEEAEAKDKRRQDALKVKVLSYKIKTMYSLGEEPYTIKVSITNKSDKAVRAFTGRIWFFDLVGEYAASGYNSKPLYELNIIHQERIKPRGTTVVTFHPEGSRDLYKSMMLLQSRKLSNLDTSFFLEELLYEDGEKLGIGL